jgi:hypothetical protein
MNDTSILTIAEWSDLIAETNRQYAEAHAAIENPQEADLIASSYSLTMLSLANGREDNDTIADVIRDAHVTLAEVTPMSLLKRVGAWANERDYGIIAVDMIRLRETKLGIG